MNVSMPEWVGNRVALLGDSITAVEKSTTHIGSYMADLCVVKNAGVGGNTIAQMLARYDADLSSVSFDLLILCCGTNDTAQSVPLTTSLSNLHGIIQKVIAQGRHICVVLPPPYSGANAQSQIALREAQALHCTRYGIPFIDPFADLIDTDGNYVAGASGDGVHPAYQAVIDSAVRFSTQINNVFQFSKTASPKANLLGLGLVSNSLMLVDSNADGWADGYGWNGFGIPSLATDSDFIGKAQKIVATGIDTSAVTFTYSGAQEYHKYLLTVKVKTTGYTNDHKTEVFFMGNTTLNRRYMIQDMRGNFTARCSSMLELGAGDTGLYFSVCHIKDSANFDATIEFGELQIYDLTSLGLA